MDGSSAEAAAHRYQSLFSDVAGISSRDLLGDSLLPSSTPTTSSTGTIQPKWRFHGHNVLLVDVRTDSERDVSMISGAVSLDEFKTNILPSFFESGTNDSALPDMIVTYCTIGFRSGMEARNLIHEYPTVFAGWENDDNSTQEGDRTSITKVGNLDGIIPFANASTEYETSSNNEQSPHKIPEPLIIDRQTKTATNKVHVYGPSWKIHLSPTYEAITFSRIEFAWRGLMEMMNGFIT
eukprot:scaffold1041_cov93-Skeletonema_dohrnii-CCMP3373.AAC.5